MSRTGPVTKDTSSVALGLAQVRVGNSAAVISNINAALLPANSIGALGQTKFNSQVDSWKLESGFPALEDISIPIRETASMEVTYKEISSFNIALARGIDPSANISASSLQGTLKTTGGTIAVMPIAVTDGGTGTAGETNWVGGVLDEEWIVLFAGAASGQIVGKTSGVTHDFVNLTSAMEPDNAGTPYFSIPSNFFTGVWADGDIFTFKTSPYLHGTEAYADNHSGEIKLGALKAPAFIRMEAVYTYPNASNHMYIIFPRANVSGSTELEMQSEDAAAPPMVLEAKRADSETSGGNAVWDDKPLGRIYFD